MTGNIVGSLVGYDAIESKWKKNLELHDVVLEMADDLCHGCIMSEYSLFKEWAWESKYMDMHRFCPEENGGRLKKDEWKAGMIREYGEEQKEINASVLFKNGRNRDIHLNVFWQYGEKAAYKLFS